MNAVCIRCGVPAAAAGVRDDRGTGSPGTPRRYGHFVRLQVAAVPHSHRSWPRTGTWATCDTCQRVTAHLNNQRLHRRRAAA